MEASRAPYAVENVPSGHASHASPSCTEPVLIPNLPGPQGSHAAMLDALVVFDQLLIGHSLHWSRPTTPRLGWYVPAGQPPQASLAVAFATIPTLPAEQAEHTAAPDAENVPIGHPVHMVAPGDTDAVPAAQGRQSLDEFPECGRNEPGAQGRHADALVAAGCGWNVPFGHPMQLCKPCRPSPSPYVRAGHGRQTCSSACPPARSQTSRAIEKWPSGQGRQRCGPGDDCSRDVMPRVHPVQFAPPASPASEKVPRGQDAHTREELAPSPHRDTLPGGHAVQAASLVCLTASEYVPAGHRAHGVTRPHTPDQEPGGHGVHAASSLSRPAPGRP